MSSITNFCKLSNKNNYSNEIDEDDPMSDDQILDLFGKEYHSAVVEENRLFVWFCYLSSTLRTWSIPKIQSKLTLDYYKTSRQNNARIYEFLVHNIDEMKCSILTDYENMVPPHFKSLHMFAENLSILNPVSKPYHIFHGHLEARMFHLKISKVLDKKISQTISFKNEYQLLLFDLIKVCIEKYYTKRYSPKMMLEDTPFFCSCIENSFVQLFKMDSQELFYDSFQKNVEILLKGSDLYEEIANERRPAASAIEHENAFYGFFFWLLCEILKMLQSRQINSFSENSSYDSLKFMWDEFKKTNHSEENSRFFLISVLPIVTGYWEFDVNFVLMLWEHFKKRLNERYFNISDKLPSPVEFSMKSTYYRPDSNSYQGLVFDKTNSFELFLCILSYSISSLTETGQISKIKKIFARIFSTFPNTPDGYLATLTSNGIYNLTLMLMTIVEMCQGQEDYPKISQCMTNLVSLQLTKMKGFSQEIVVERIQMMTLGNMALIISLQYREFNFGSHLSRFLTILDTSYKKMFGLNRLLSCFDIVSSAMIHVFRVGGDASLGEELFFNNWLNDWVSKSDDRDKILKLTCNLMKKDKFVKNMEENLLNPIKCLYNNSEIKSSYVAEMAGHFCVKSLESRSKNDFKTLFNFFESSECASIDSKLIFFRQILDSDKVTPSIIGENVLIGNWIKFVVLKNSEIISQMTEMVCDCDKFRAVCDVPTFDVTTADDPILVVLKSIGEKFNNFKEDDFHNKAAYQRIVHEFFLTVHNWTKDPDPESLKKILYFLANALKICGRAVYSRMSGNCLFNTAFKSYFLVLPEDNPKSSVEAMIKVWHLIMESIGQLDYQTENSLIDYQNSMILKWIPAFDRLDSLTEMSRPFEELLYSENQEFVRKLFQKICIYFVDLQKNYIPKKHANIVLKIFKQILNSLITSEKDNAFCFFHNVNAGAIYTHAINCIEGNPSKVEAGKCITAILNYFDNCQSDVVRKEITGTFKEVASKFILNDNDAGYFFRYMENISQKHTQFAKSTVDIIRFAVSDAEVFNNMGAKNIQLRHNLSKYEGAILAFEQRGTRVQIESFS